MDEIKNVTFTRFGGSHTTMQPVVPGDTVNSVIDKVREELNLGKGGAWMLVDKATNVEIQGNVYGQVEDLGNVIVTPADTGGV